MYVQCAQHDSILPRVKELVGLIAASDNSRERGMVVERILDDLIRKEKENLATKIRKLVSITITIISFI